MLFLNSLDIPMGVTLNRMSEDMNPSGTSHDSERDDLTLRRGKKLSLLFIDMLHWNSCSSTLKELSVKNSMKTVSFG
jgi:hypothetical protein